jgi:hypothetical protein
MDALALILTLTTALVILHDSRKRGGGMNEFLSAWLLKTLGALAGSSLAAWWRKATRRLLQIISGWWVGTVSGGWLIDFMQWPLTPDYLLMSGSIMGLIGFSLMEGLLVLEWRHIAARIGRASK